MSVSLPHVYGKENKKPQDIEYQGVNCKRWVEDGTRTRDPRYHKPML